MRISCFRHFKGTCHVYVILILGTIKVVNNANEPLTTTTFSSWNLSFFLLIIQKKNQSFYNHVQICIYVEQCYGLTYIE